MEEIAINYVMAGKSTVLNCGDFQAMRTLSVAQLKDKLEEVFVEKAKQCLISAPINMNPKFAFVAATDIIVGGRRIFENIDECDEDKEKARSKNAEKEKLYKMSDRFRNMKDEAMLVIRSFSSKETKEQCDGKFTDPIENIGKVFPNLIHSGADLPIIYSAVQEWSIIKQSLLDFFTRVASKANTVVIVFHGNMTQDGLKIAESNSIPLETILNYVSDCFKECLERYILPQRVEVVYQETNSNFNVKFTDPFVDVISLSHKGSVGVTRSHYKVLLNESGTLSSQFSNVNIVHPAGRTNPMFDQYNYMTSREPYSYSSLQSTQSSTSGSVVHPSSSTWSVEELGFDTTD